ncbi:MAG: hypothetical protein QOI92_1171 [Chloroflexota bacterium]|nr:hypothetical protein [Chloroflexota bacterium]
MRDGEDAEAAQRQVAPEGRATGVHRLDVEGRAGVVCRARDRMERVLDRGDKPVERRPLDAGGRGEGQRARAVPPGEDRRGLDITDVEGRLRDAVEICQGVMVGRHGPSLGG